MRLKSSILSASMGRSKAMMLLWLCGCGCSLFLCCHCDEQEKEKRKITEQQAGSSRNLNSLNNRILEAFLLLPELLVKLGEEGFSL
jgi:hypothetical protein